MATKKRKLGLEFEESDDEEDDYDTIKHEVEAYQHEAVLGLDENPLEWWHLEKGKFPHIARLARYSTVQYSTVQYSTV